MTEYWLPSWWGWIDRWDRCQTCLAYNGTSCAGCEIPPGLLGLAQLVGGGTATVAGNLRGNATIRNQQQARAAGRVADTRVGSSNVDVVFEELRDIQRVLERNEIRTRDRR